MTPRLLDRIDRPQDLHALSEEQLAQVAEEVRGHIIDTVGEIGGHFGANLGTCELAVALHSLMDSPRDKILWDVGHQAYPHKILTGRRDQLATIRQYEGLAPFCSIAESEHDIMGAGHASTAIGYAVGLKEAMRLRGETDAGKVVAVVGDGAMTGGVAFEAIHHAGGLGTPIVVVLNDNGMSIAPNVGALSRYFNRVRLNPKLWHAREGVEGRLVDLPLAGPAFERLGPQLKESIKAFWAPGLLWEELDWAYTGVIDGHDVRALRVALSKALAADRPVVVHIATVKGRGFAPAEEGGLAGMEQWHAAKPGSVVDRAPAPKPRISKTANGPAPKLQYTQVFGQSLVAEARRDPRVVGITAAMNSGTGLSLLQEALPDRYFDVGIAEQHALLLAAGMALEGAKPVAAIYSTFLQRAFDQIVHDVCLQHLNVVLAMDRAGLVGDDGPTHHGAFDIAYLRALPNITLMAPRDEAMLVHMLHTAPGLGPRSRRPALPARRGRWRPAPRRAGGAGDRDGGDPARGCRARRDRRLRQRRREGPGGGRGAGHARHRGDRRRRPVRQAARRAPARRPGRRARAARHGRGGRARRRLRQRGVGDAGRRRGGRAAHPADRAARPLHHARQARPAARRGRLHRASHRRAHRGRGVRSALGPRRSLDAPSVHGLHPDGGEPRIRRPSGARRARSARPSRRRPRTSR